MMAVERWRSGEEACRSDLKWFGSFPRKRASVFLTVKLLKTDPKVSKI